MKGERYETRKNEPWAIKEGFPGWSRHPPQKHRPAPHEGRLEAVGVTCAKPMKAWKQAGGGITFVGERAASPFALSLPCGQCMSCRLDRAHEWTTRLQHEFQTTEAEGKPSIFLTLTYNDEHLPKDLGLHVSEWQGFAKRWRSRSGPFRFYMVGEYGEDSLRPHFHAVIFGQSFEDRFRLKDTRRGVLWTSPTLIDLWGRGFSSFGAVNETTIRYVAQYGLKKLNGERGKDRYRRNDGRKQWQVRPEFSTMSKGIGKRWFERWGADVYPRDELRVGGTRARTPRYYDELLKEQQGDDALEMVKERRKERADERAADLSDERREAKEEILKLRARNRRRGN